MKGAGGSSGGIGHFFIGLLMMCSGFYMLLNAITVTANFGLGSRLYNLSAFGTSFGVTSGTVMIPFIFGIGLIFYNSRNILGWLLSIGSITALIFGVISSIRFSLRTMSSFDLIVILVLAVGGLGLFLRSLKKLDAKYS
ncbi:hypothetical protein [Pseudoalteromonas tunicata]|uniref:Uncharacterized protein n=1 Tax=Pseudoalteromonas tunicata D2 TaxID=87626 RepID=A4CFP5_9GAMM|nr:hypothetical protein [Pseudoalteromonas tunicata]ATC94143.1 hypothetical protein PTUN_a1526 [Pseudoalteromonas tunicata]AXT29910.1 hypothetical protein D1819_03150 [Pseudoalteromonas tunicata]EAR26472.1 hypothetical protein PTD2_04776 [Pseudoalteromonas tunicata D2]MDP4982577.1 hypothetical protein [Pseudoalteromonas tunicata]MDP5215276.1 hypothetical protein [Pseudoalteromonas tunicata]